MGDALPGLVMAQQQRIRWHLLNMGSTEDIHSVHFHGQIFSVRTSQEYRMGVYNLYPGEMRHVVHTLAAWLHVCTHLDVLRDGKDGEWIRQSQALRLHSIWHHCIVL